ncbi:MAG TPA: transporter [Smithella sp.]|nr:transporter [Smithella sp.]
MKSRIFINLLSMVFITCSLFAATPVMAQEPAKGSQVVLKAINADDAENAVDDETSQSSQPKAKKVKKNENLPQSPQPEATDLKTELKNESPETLEQKVEALRQEIQKMRSENEARKRLEVPEEEKTKSTEDILSAVGNQYVLLKKGIIGLQYSLNYAYYSSDVVSSSVIESRSNHNLTNTIILQYGLLNNLTMYGNVPFDYKYNAVGTSSSQESTNLGDISLGLQVQPFKAGGYLPTTIITLGVSIPTGTSPYAIDTNNSLSTGAGVYSISGGVSLSKVLDPLVAFGNLTYAYNFPESGLSATWGGGGYVNEVDLGSSIGCSFGFGYALSYQASLNMGTQLTYSFSSKYHLNGGTTYETGSALSAMLNIGTGWRLSETRSVNVTVGIGMTVNDPDISLTFTVPFEF